MKSLIAGFVALGGLISVPANAADLPVKARPLVVDPTYDWSGFYIGAGTGGVWYEARRFMPDLPLVGIPPTLFRAHSSDWIYDGHVGVQRQWGRWVVGLEGAYNGSRGNMRSDVSVSPPEPFSNFNATVFITDLVTVGPKVGYTWDRLMVYGTGGYAGANIDGRYTCTFGGQFIFPGRAPCNFPLFGVLADLNLSGTTWNNGWFAGFGFDYVVHKGSFADVLLGAEYQHFDLDRKQAVTCTPTLCPGVQHQSFLHDANGDIARVRLSFKTHGWGMQ